MINHISKAIIVFREILKNLDVRLIQLYVGNAVRKYRIGHISLNEASEKTYYVLHVIHIELNIS